MVKTRRQLKESINEYISTQTNPFTTGDVRLYCQSLRTNINTNPQRLKKYIGASGLATYDKSRKEWNIKTQAFTCHDQRTNNDKPPS